AIFWAWSETPATARSHICTFMPFFQKLARVCQSLSPAGFQFETARSSTRNDARVQVLMMVLKLLALGLTALALVPSAAHLFELRAKMRLTETQYFTVQSIYAGWALFSLAIIAAIVANGALWWSLRRHCIPAARWAMASSL